MSGLELFAIGVIAALMYALVTMFLAIIVQGEYGEIDGIGGILAWIFGGVLFVIVVVLWASGIEFPFGR